MGSFLATAKGSVPPPWGKNERCFSCGSKQERGGWWSGFKCVIVCSREECIETLFHLALDAMFEFHPTSCIPFGEMEADGQRKFLVEDHRRCNELHRKFIAMAERVFWYKELLRLRDLVKPCSPLDNEGVHRIEKLI